MTSNGILDEFRGAFYRSNYGHVQLILVNIAVWLLVRLLGVILTLSVGAEAVQSFMLYLELPSNLSVFITRPWTIITYMFLHWDLFHILFNMLFLYWFGKLIAEYLGSDKVIKLYVLGGLTGGILYMLIYNLVPFYEDRAMDSHMLGASAGVFAVVVGAATFMPNFKFFLLLIGPVKIVYIAIFYVFISFISITGANAGGDLAHLGGAAMGYLYIRQFQKGNDLGGFIMSFLGFVKSFFVKQSKIKVSYSRNSSGRTRKSSRSSAGTAGSGKPDQDEIDAILDKISNSGYESLTKDEKQKLFNASKH